jgi:hypothetical protein
MTYQRSRQSKRPALTVLGTLVALCTMAAGTAGCSARPGTSGPGTAAVASLPGQSGQPGGALRPLTTQQSDLDMVNFAHCMRAHGVQMADPFHRPGHVGLSIDMPTQDAATRPAYAACLHFMQAIIQVKQAGAASQAAPELPALTRYAQCMRGHDIGMLDPTPQGALSLGNVPGITSDFGRYSPQFRAADTACRHFLPAGVSDNGTGP